MGAMSFCETVRVSKKTSDKEAFQEARDQAAFENGHGGYTGSLAEKHGFIMIHRARNEQNANRIADKMMDTFRLPVYRDEMMEIAHDKWGPAAAVRYPIDKATDGVIFFGYASS